MRLFALASFEAIHIACLAAVPVAAATGRRAEAASTSVAVEPDLELWETTQADDAATLHGCYTSLLQESMTMVQLQVDPLVEAAKPATAAPAPANAQSPPSRQHPRPRSRSERRGARAWLQRSARLGHGGMHTSRELAELEAMHNILPWIAICCLVLAGLMTVFYYFSKGNGHAEDDDKEEEVVVCPNEQFDENTMMLACSLLVRDAQQIALGDVTVGLRMGRIFFAVGLLFLTLFLQIIITVTIKLYVTPQQVSSIRESYDAYERQMYSTPDGVEHIYVLSTGRARGMEGYFNESNFASLDDDTKSGVCNIPFSRMSFFAGVIFIWSVMCVAQLKRAVGTLMSLIVATPSIKSMADALDIDEELEGNHSRVVVGLVPAVKVLMVVFVFIPWIGTTAFVMWLGCRWLSATNDFTNIVTNSVALAYILEFKEILYLAVVSERSKRELRSTYMLPVVKREKAGWFVFFNNLTWGIVALAWVILYVTMFQQVLPQYKWDVSQVCTSYLRTLL